MPRFTVVATAGAGGDLQPLVAAALALRSRGHEIRFVGDDSVRRAVEGLSVDADLLPAHLDLGPRLVAAIREAMAASGGDQAAAGPLVQQRLAEWATESAGPVSEAITRHDPACVITSLFGVEVLEHAVAGRPWAVVNSTFYVGPVLQRPAEQDFAARAVPLLTRYAALLGAPSLVLHATDPVFDYSFGELPERHHYCGPLGVWEPPADTPEYVDDHGDPWVLVTLSSQLQDDAPLASAALAAVAGLPVRAVVTTSDHDPASFGSVPEHVHVERYASHSALLARGALLVSHAGHGSVMKALWHGRPMVLVPWGRDQPGVAARAAALGVAEVVPREHVDAPTLARAIESALGDERMRAAAERHGARLRATDPPAEAARLLETLL